MLPKHPDQHFTGRANELEQIRQMLSKSPPDKRRVSIFGMTGVGKSQLALKFAYNSKDMHENVFFVQATSRQEILEHFEKIYKSLQLPESSSHNQEQKAEDVRQWLIKNPSWIIIFDNVVDAEITKEYLPVGATGALPPKIGSQPWILG